MRYYVLWHDGTKYGPIDLVGLADWVREGRVSPTTQLEEVETCRRYPASTVPGLFGQLSSATAPIGPTLESAMRGENLVGMSWAAGFLGLVMCPFVGPVVGIVFAKQAQRLANPGAKAALVFNVALLGLSVFSILFAIFVVGWWHAQT
ncbi:MAG: hypothetical protein KIS66_16565 [Fimbriimonadaceae bacterium]|nr:hypothetical protein [Fimbriimonadaceae bacterium]